MSDFENPAPSLLPDHLWDLLVRYFEERGCYHSGWRPHSAMRIVEYITRKGNKAWMEEGPYPAESHGTQTKPGFGDKKCHEVGGIYMGLPKMERRVVEATVLGAVLGDPTKMMRWAAREMKISMRWCWALRKKAFERICTECERKGL